LWSWPHWNGSHGSTTSACCGSCFTLTKQPPRFPVRFTHAAGVDLTATAVHLHALDLAPGHPPAEPPGEVVQFVCVIDHIAGRDLAIPGVKNKEYRRGITQEMSSIE